MKNGIGLTVTIALMAVIAFAITACESEAVFEMIGSNPNGSGLTIYGMEFHEGKKIKATAFFTVNNTGVTLLASLPPVKNYYSLSSGRFDGTFTFTPLVKVTHGQAVMQVYKYNNQSDYPIYTGNDQNVYFDIYMPDDHQADIFLGFAIVNFSNGNARGQFIEVDHYWVAAPGDFLGGWEFNTMSGLHYIRLEFLDTDRWQIYFYSSADFIYGKYEIANNQATLYREDYERIGAAHLITPATMSLELPSYFSGTYFTTKN